MRLSVAASLALALIVATPAPAQRLAADKERFEKIISALPDDSSVIVNRAGETLHNDATLIIGRCHRPKKPCPIEKAFRWASVTKQLIAVLVMQEVAKGRIDLDAPLSRYIPRFASPNASQITVRQLLQHRSGLPNPDDTLAGEGGIASYYLPAYSGNRDPLNGYCAGPPKGKPGGNWAYNNCDYLVAGVLLERVTGKRWERLVEQRIAKPLKLISLQYGGTTRTRDFFSPDGKGLEPDIDLAAFGAAGGMHGTPSDLIAFDIALMNGRLLSKDEMQTLWDGRPELGFIALGQWVFEAPLKGCATPVRIVERRGAIGKVQVRNFILPDQKIAAVAFVESPKFDFGEIWQGSGFSHDLLAEAACK